MISGIVWPWTCQRFNVKIKYDYDFEMCFVTGKDNQNLNMTPKGKPLIKVYTYFSTLEGTQWV